MKLVFLMSRGMATVLTVGLLLISGSKLRAQVDQDPVWSANATVAIGSAFTPSYSGGDGSGDWQFYVSGYTSCNYGSSGDGGTEYGSGWHYSWTPTAAGTYTFYVVHDGDWDYNPSSLSSGFTLTVTKANQATPTSSNATINALSAFTPSYSGGSGSGSWQFIVTSQTSWDTGTSGNAGTIVSSSWVSSWTPTTAGTYTFQVARNGDSNYNSSGASATYTLTVNHASQAGVSSSDATINFNGTTQSYPAFTPTYSGGSGSGGWQFCMAGYTGWDVATSSNTGTSSGSGGTGTWSSSWTPTSPGSYSFWVGRDGDGTYSSSGASSSHTLTVNGPVAGVTWNSNGLPSTGTAYQPISFSVSVSNSGTSYWDSSYYLEAFDPSNNPITPEASISGIYPGSSKSATIALTLPAGSTTTATNYTYTFKVLNGSGYFGSSTTQTISVNPLSAPSITSSLTATGTYNSAFSYTITASNYPTSFGASGLPPGLSVNTSTGVISGTPTSAGSWSATISATNPSGTSPAYLAITINPISATFTISPTSFSYTGSSQGPTITPSPSGATYSVTNGSATNEGSYSLSVTATGNYSGTGSATWTIGLASPVVLTSAATNYATLVWAPSPTSTGGTVSYKVYSGSTTSSGSLLYTTNGTSYVVYGLTPGSTYTYTVQAIDSLTSPSTTVTLTAVSNSDSGSKTPEQLVGLSSTTSSDSSNKMGFVMQNPH